MNLLLIIALFLKLIVSPAHSQEFDFNKAYQDYLYNYDIYQKTHSDYDIARSQYMSSQTISAQTRAQETTAAMLVARDQALITYLTALRMKLKDTPGIGDAAKDGLFAPIDTEIAWHTDHKSRISSAGSLEDLTEDSTEAAVQFRQTELLIYKVLITVSIGNTTDYRDREREIINSLRTKISEIKAAGGKDVTSVERALTDADDRLSRSVEKEQEALNLFLKVKAQDKDKLSKFNSIELSVGEALAYIKEANSIVKDSIRQIKTAD